MEATLARVYPITSAMYNIINTRDRKGRDKTLNGSVGINGQPGNKTSRRNGAVDRNKRAQFSPYQSEQNSLKLYHILYKINTNMIRERKKILKDKKKNYLIGEGAGKVRGEQRRL